MRMHVIILAQGNQSRLTGVTMPKQFLPLPDCGKIAIMLRTLQQLDAFAGTAMRMAITVVCHLPMHATIRDYVMQRLLDASGTSDRMSVAVESLTDPGNSSLKGISRFFSNRYHGPTSIYGPISGAPYDATCVLFGDAVYSWHCLGTLLDVTEVGVDRPVIVCGTSDLSPSSGELWGVSWMATQGDLMKRALDKAMTKHPPFHDTYQPGQMRQWLWALPADVQESAFVRVDDYTRDVDLPEHLKLLPELSHMAKVDDEAHGVTW